MEYEIRVNFENGMSVETIQARDRLHAMELLVRMYRAKQRKGYFVCIASVEFLSSKEK